MQDTKHVRIRERILLGGGIGAGKSAAGRRLADHGATVIEADHIGHGLLEPGGYAFAAVSDRWPMAVVDGRIDRGKLAAVVFDDEAELAELEAMTHPVIVERIVEIASRCGDVVVEIPLILDIPGEWTHVFIDADEGLRLRRAVERGGREADVKKRMASQPSHDEWTKWSDATIHNNGSTEDLEKQIDSLWYGLRSVNQEPGR